MAENPLKTIEKLDPQLYALIQESRKLALGEGALDRKTKILIAMALDASHGAADGVKSLAGLAMQNGATREEIAEVLRITNFISGVGSIYTASRALSDLT